jgi:hypothetical protein
MFSLSSVLGHFERWQVCKDKMFLCRITSTRISYTDYRYLYHLNYFYGYLEWEQQPPISLRTRFACWTRNVKVVHFTTPKKHHHIVLDRLYFDLGSREDRTS